MEDAKWHAEYHAREHGHFVEVKALGCDFVEGVKV